MELRRAIAMSQERFSSLGCNDETVEKFENTYFISMFGSQDPSPFFKDHHPNVLLVQVDDIDEDKLELAKNNQLMFFTNDQAKQIIEFLQDMNDDFTLIVHCGAGVCRSGAVVEFARGILHLEYDEFKRDNPHILPNLHILKTLRLYYLEHYSTWANSEN